MCGCSKGGTSGGGGTPPVIGTCDFTLQELIDMQSDPLLITNTLFYAAVTSAINTYSNNCARYVVFIQTYVVPFLNP